MVWWLRLFTALSMISSLSLVFGINAFDDTKYRNRFLITGNETDRLSLLAFKDEITHDPLGILISWNDSTHFCEWLGVACGRRHQRVTKLGLNSTKLEGALSPHIGNLTFLRVLDLGGNSFRGSIPQQLGHLLRLGTLLLTNNAFSGLIPVSLSRCSNLRAIHLDGNRLEGRIPKELGSLSRLEEFVFLRNNISGVLPLSLGNLSSLHKFSAAYNSLSGVIPESFGQIRKLQILAMGVNDLSGPIPASLYNISSLTAFDVGFNQLEGSLPPDLGVLLPKIEFFGVYGNRLKGKFPVTISNASKLSVLQLQRNGFTGEVPPLTGLTNLRVFLLYENGFGRSEDGDLNFLYGLSNCSNLVSLLASENRFGGSIPEYVSNFSTTLRRLTFDGNKIRGSIPAEIGNLVGLDVLALNRNQLAGNIPKSICKLQKLVIFHLNNNELSGKIPYCLGNVTSLLRVDLMSNNLEGEIPASLGNWKGLLSFQLSQNRLSGTIPREILKMSSLNEIYLSYNQLIGSIPLDVCKSVNLKTLDLSNNRLSGEIPRALNGCTSVEQLYLQGNLLHGTIPQSLSSLRAIQSLDLSCNNLSGRIPEFLEDFNLLNLNLSYNSFEGAIPLKGAFENASAVFLSGNEKLCGGFSELHLPQCSAKKLKHNLVGSLKWILAVASGSFLLIALSILICVEGLGKVKKEPSTSPLAVSILQVSYATLVKATGGFSSDNLIGRGSSGSVYKGMLKPDTQADGTNEPNRQIVAVKVLNLENQGASTSFISECEMLRNIRHRNVVKILTSCSGIDFQGNDFKALVYEFMENGSLHEWLHPMPICDKKSRTLGFLQRLNVSLDVACALDYLHHGCETPIVHCDVKPGNVLLDGKMAAHLSDFGLAKFLHEATHNSVSDNQSSSVAVKGTIGYTPPEYGMGGEISTYGDRYSYGIMLLEMFTGKRPTDNMFIEGLNLRDFVEAALPEGVLKVVDPILLQANGEGDRLVWYLSSVFQIGLECSVELPTDRMDITNVVTRLISIHAKFQ